MFKDKITTSRKYSVNVTIAHSVLCCVGCLVKSIRFDVHIHSAQCHSRTSTSKTYLVARLCCFMYIDTED